MDFLYIVVIGILIYQVVKLNKQVGDLELKAFLTKGAKGDTGPQGAKGPMGEDGDDGITPLELENIKFDIELMKNDITAHNKYFDRMFDQDTEE